MYKRQDQPIVAGDIDYFYLTSDLLSFSNGFVSKDDCEIKGTILQITHPELGELKGIITMGLDYYLYLADGTELIVNAEESPCLLYTSIHPAAAQSCPVQHL